MVRVNPLVAVLAVRVLTACGFAACVLAGCGGEGGVEAPDGPPAAVIATGTDALVLLHDGDPIGLIRGPQGGVMVSLGVYASGIDPGSMEEPVGSDRNPVIEWRVAVEGADSAEARYRLALDPQDEQPSCFARWHLFVQLVGFTVEDVEDLVGAALAVDLTVTDRDDRVARASVRLVGDDPLAP
jgi:hypothetical protein